MASEGISILGIQEITVIALAPLLILLTAGQSWLHRGWHREVERIMSIQFWGLIVVSVVQWVAFETTHNDTLNIRPIAMSAVFLGAWYMGEYIAAGTGVRRIVVLGLLVTLTLSRMAFAIYLAATLVSLIARSLRVRKTARKQATGAATAFIAVAALGVGMVFVGGPLHSRSSQGDVSLKVLGVSINGEGRADFWRTLRNESIGVGFTGMGAGAAERVIADNFNDIGQPHNDYLKLWFNFGWTGLALFLGGWVVVMYRLVSALRAGGLGQDDLKPIAAAFLSGLALLVFMTTDNPIAYAPVTGQWALVVGTALGASGRTNPRQRAAAASR
jgi:O-antigen ligase